MGAQHLRFTLAHDPPAPALDPKRHDVIQNRLESGFYRQPDVLLETASRLLADLMSGDPLDDLADSESPGQRER